MSTRALSPRKLADAALSAYVPLVLAVLVVVFPLLWMVFSSFKPLPEIITQTPALFPSDPTWANYATATERLPFGRVFANSVLVTVIGSAIKVALAVLTAYGLVFVRFPFKNVIFAGLLVTLMVPPQVSLLPNYTLITSLGGADTYWGIILPGLGTAFGTFLMRQHFRTLPPSLLEAAELDGAGHWRRLTRVVLPVSGPTVATVALVTIVNEWNDYLWPLVIVSRPDMMTLPVGLTLLANVDNRAAAYGQLMAGSVAVIVPVLIVFIALQRHIIAGLTQGAVKD
ncbi:MULTISPECIES: carbohydrate ABC transporter permease [Pseudonocardia]|uniref:L-arabinose transport system permease protein AraQ n=2 Tax=Pseudonocardia TaxID=1847 RepID=A0A1Y2MYU9_PSEAH|nr:MULTISPECIES: carbohydrate ABC transporter permease [Pseudonocardia]OSY40384.1 L-arabinose transport system permease protein AraQ [Pseudonocardia autotrophica]TDN72285.1 carbohydrate ABC transporter membrane protein 2 (CUT1 family) [Pseudonocardia autotrophica]BBG02997.1 glycerol-3-phosphate ABC transporter permease [Pseudonocardia autotrophica]GEC25101.1 glycerol-3-phosphate ABC transporter permease [Pseudonocardia saturnea]